MKKAVSGTPNVQSITRALEILEAMRQNHTGWNLQALSKKVGLHRATVHRILSTLERRGYVDQDPVTRQYRLGLRVFDLGTAYLGQKDIVRIGQPILDEITEQTSHTSYLGMLDGDQGIVMAVSWLGRGLKVISQVGDRRPLYATAFGKILLASLSDTDVESYLSRTKLVPLTEYTIVSPKDLRAEVKLVRARGYAENREASFIGVRSVAAPVTDQAGVVRASISLAWPKDAVPPEKEPDLLRVVLEGAQKLGSRLVTVVGSSPMHR